MSVVLPLQIPQRFEVDPFTKAVWRMRASTFKMMKKKTTSLFYLSFYTAISLGSLKKKEKQA